MYLLGQASLAAKQRLLDSELLQENGITDAAAVRDALGVGPGFVGTDIHDAPAKNPPVNADEFGIADSADSWNLKKLTWANIKAALASAFFPLNAARHGNLGGGSLHAAATTGTAGFMSGTDKTKLDGLGPVDEDRIASAWVNFQGTGTVTVRDSYNVSSVSDNGSGDYTVNFASALANTNYSFFGTGPVAPSAGNQIVVGYRTTGSFTDLPTDKSTTSLRILCRSTEGTNRDADQYNVLIFGGN